MLRQPERQLRPEDHHRQHHEHDEMKRDRAVDHFGKFAIPDALYHEQVDADRRRNLPELDVDHQHHAEQDRIDAVAAENRKQQRHRDHDHAEALDQAAEHGEQAEQHEIKLQSRELHADNEFSEFLADAGKTDRVGEYVGGEDQEQDVAGEILRRVHRLDQLFHRQVAE